MLRVDWDLRSFWNGLTHASGYYIFCLLLVAGYTIYFFAKTLYRLHCLKRSHQLNGTLANSPLLSMSRGIENLRQLHLLFLLLFALFFANENFVAFRAVAYSDVHCDVARFDFSTGFAYFVSAVLTVLHILQWIASARLRRSLPST